MAKARTAYVCSECGADFNKWQGQCGACGAWDTLSEIVLESAAAQKSPASRRSGWAGKVDAPKVTALKDVRHHEDARVSTGIGEFDRVLGGGLVEGAVVLVGGDPGIGKSTLRSEEHTSELQSLMRISYAVFCLKKKKKIQRRTMRTDPRVH